MSSAGSRRTRTSAAPVSATTSGTAPTSRGSSAAPGRSCASPRATRAPDRGTISSPGDARGALAVGAADKTGAVAFYSSRGPVPGVRYRKPDLLAIGGG
ncbi:MAG TPA: hypothetical protein DCK98_15540 [Chloroflexi bacterium]|nr:hypothetical protein [Chloroflexota bacterium]HAL28563.1 hypothetical protein [Chloroflexota bacterium]